MSSHRFEASVARVVFSVKDAIGLSPRSRRALEEMETLEAMLNQVQNVETSSNGMAGISQC